MAIFRVFRSLLGEADESGLVPERSLGCDGIQHVTKLNRLELGSQGPFPEVQWAKHDGYEEAGPCDGSCGCQISGFFTYVPTSNTW